MPVTLSIQSNVPAMIARLKAKGKNVGAVFQDPQFGKAVQSYITGRTTKFIREMGSIGDAPAKRTLRGVTWGGYATHQTRKYGQTVTEGTRSRWRGHKRNESAAKGAHRIATSKLGKKDIRASFGNARNNVTLEKVWNKRPAGDGSKSRRYSESSQMMAASGHLLGFTAFVQRTVSGGGNIWTMVLRAGQQVSYFHDLSKKRPIWFWYPQEDGPAVATLLGRAIGKILGNPPK